MPFCAAHVRLWPIADIPSCTAHVRYWVKSGHFRGQSGHQVPRVANCHFMSAFGGKADMAMIWGGRATRLVLSMIKGPRAMNDGSAAQKVELG